MRCLALLALFAALLPATPANAFCSYRGKMYATTTLAEEFRDAKWVVKARVEIADEHWANSGESWTIYDVRILTRFKGPPAHDLRLFTFRDSGGFYLDKGTSPDLNSDWLLFLDPAAQPLPRGIGKVVEVNYACGQSRLWSNVSPVDRQALARLAAH